MLDRDKEDVKLNSPDLKTGTDDCIITKFSEPELAECSAEDKISATSAIAGKQVYMREKSRNWAGAFLTCVTVNVYMGLGMMILEIVQRAAASSIVQQENKLILLHKIIDSS